MEKHLKIGLIFAITFTFVFLTINAIVWASEDVPTILLTISDAILVPLAWFWELIGVSGCRALGYIVFILLSVPLYYLAVGFFTGFLFSALIGAIVTTKESGHYSKTSSLELENENSDFEKNL